MELTTHEFVQLVNGFDTQIFFCDLNAISISKLVIITVIISLIIFV